MIPMLSEPNINAPGLPLVVDLDGTLVRSDLLYESFFNVLTVGPLHYLRAIKAVAQGKAALKQYLADVSNLDYASLPYDETVIGVIRAAKATGRGVHLATAANEKHAAAIAKYLGLFDRVFASNAKTNLSRQAKADALVLAFGENGFEYIGNSSHDLPVWQKAAGAYGAHISRSVERKLASVNKNYSIISPAEFQLRPWLRALRPHQYVKNLLVFVPVLTAHRFDALGIGKAVIAFLAFSLCASAVYVVNDLIDLKSDRAHPTKRRRPFAAGQISLPAGFALVPGLLCLAAATALSISPSFLAVLAAYFCVTTAYSFSLKRKMLVDVVILAMLYTSRIFGGAVAIDAEMSHWLAMFSLFFFTSLALMKRYSELVKRDDTGPTKLSSRNYASSDLPMIGALAAAAGLNAVTVFSLYISSDAVIGLYRRPEVLWLIVPLLTYWIARALMMAHRRYMDDDPIVFALRDGKSLLTLAFIIVGVLLSI
jgi:4-hydroxybenzoate polyprenyltransferase